MLSCMTDLVQHTVQASHVRISVIRAYKWDPHIAGPPKRLLTHKRLHALKSSTQTCKQLMLWLWDAAQRPGFLPALLLLLTVV